MLRAFWRLYLVLGPGAACAVSCSSPEGVGSGLVMGGSGGSSSDNQSGPQGTVWCVSGLCEDGTTEPSCSVCAEEPECDCPNHDDCRWFVDVDGDGVLVEAGVLARAFHDESAIVFGCEPLFAADCDDEDPERFLKGALDEDGDGHPSRSICSFPGEPGVLFDGGRTWDCDDQNPNTYIRGYVDRDGDGITAEYICAGPDDPIFGSPVGNDCDDGDPDVSSLQYVDADGDGYGDPLRSSCEPPRDDLVRQGGDCDDADPGRPTFIEYFGDGYDGDCDGNDGTDIGYCQPKTADSRPTPCFGVNLTLREHCVPNNCNRTRQFSITNHGTEPFAGSVTLAGFASISVDLELALAPGEFTLPFVVFGFNYGDEIYLHSDAEDCDPDKRSVPAGYCEVP